MSRVALEKELELVSAVAMLPPLTALERSLVTAEWSALADEAPVETVSTWIS